MLKANDLFISADGTYPGICIGADTIDARYVRIKWYKWGYNSFDIYRDLERSEAVIKLLATPADIQKKFWTLPPEYNPEIETTGEKIEQLKWLAKQFAGASYLRSEENGDDESVDAAMKALVKFYLEGRE